MYTVRFIDTNQQETINQFDEFTAAQLYWDLNAAEDHLIFGQLIDEDNGEIIWEFES